MAAFASQDWVSDSLGRLHRGEVLAPMQGAIDEPGSSFGHAPEHVVVQR